MWINKLWCLKIWIRINNNLFPWSNIHFSYITIVWLNKPLFHNDLMKLRFKNYIYKTSIMSLEMIHKSKKNKKQLQFLINKEPKVYKQQFKFQVNNKCTATLICKIILKQELCWILNKITLNLSYRDYIIPLTASIITCF